MSATWDTKAVKATPIAADEILLIDTADTRNQKRATLSSLGATFWSRNAGSGFLFPSTLTDSVAIGHNNPTAILDIQRTAGGGGAVRSQIKNLATSGFTDHFLLNSGGLSVALRIGGSTLSADFIAGVPNANLMLLVGTASNLLIGNTSNSPIEFMTNNLERMRISNDGNLGIGLTNPVNILDIQSTSGVGLSVKIQIKNLTSNGFSDIALINTGGRFIGLQLAGAGVTGNFLPGILNANLAKITVDGDNFVFGNQGNSPVQFITNNLERMRILSGGNIGIGLTAPTELLQMFGGNFSLKPHNPTIVATKKDDTNLNVPRRIYVVNNHAYIVSETGNSLTVLDITTPSAPVILATLVDAVNLNGPHDIFVAGDFAYIACIAGNRLTLIDISTPAVPVFKSQIAVTGAFAVYVSGVHAYVTDKVGSRLVIIDIHNPVTLTQDGALTDATNFGLPTDVYVSGRYAYITGELTDSLAVVDIIDDTAPVTVGQVFDGTAMNSPQALYIVGNHAYVVSNISDSLAIVNVATPTAPVVTSSLINPTFESNSVLDGARHIFVSENHAYITAQDADAFTIVDITIPATPAVVGSVNNAVTLNGAHGVFVSGKFAYTTASLNNSMSVIDIHGMDMPNANIGNLEVGSLSVKDNVIIADDLYAASINAGGDVLVGGQLAVSSKLSVFGDLTVADDLLTVNSTDKSVQIGGATVAADFSIVQQTTQAKRGILLTGNGFFGGNITTDGVFISNLLNITGNMQIGIGQLSDFGNAGKNIFRYIVGIAVPQIGGVSGDGTTNTHLMIGNQLSKVGIGFPASGTLQSQIISNLHVKAGTTATIAQIIQAVGVQTVDLLQVRNNAGAVQLVIDENFRLGIGVTDPAEKLDILGNIKLSGTINTNTIPAGTNTFAMLGVANVFTADQKISGTSKLLFGSGTGEFIHVPTTNILKMFAENKLRLTLQDEGVIIGDSTTAKARQVNFLHIPTTVGRPDGSPQLITGVQPMAFDTVDNELFVFNDSVWRQVSTHTYGREITIIDQTAIASTVFQNSSLSIFLRTGETYSGIATIYLESDNTPGFKYTFIIPANTVNGFTGGTLSSLVPVSILAMDATTVITTDGSPQVIVIHFRINPTADGNLIFRWAQNVASGTSKLLRGSSMVIWEEQ